MTYAEGIAKLMQASRILRKRKPTRDESLLALDTFGIEKLRSCHRHTLTAEELQLGGQDYRLRRLQQWERETFGRVFTHEYNAKCDLDPKHLTT